MRRWPRVTKEMGTVVDSMNRRNVKICAAVIGGSAVVALGAISTAVAQQPSGDHQFASGASVGAVTSSSPTPPGPAEESVMSAAPQVKASDEYFPGESPNHTPV